MSRKAARRRKSAYRKVAVANAGATQALPPRFVVSRTVHITETIEVPAPESQRPRTIPDFKEQTLVRRSLGERFFAVCTAFVHHGFLVLFVVWIPVAVQLGIFYVRHWTIDARWLAAESYGIACITAFALFAELLRDDRGHPLPRMLHAYRTFLLWIAPLVAATCLLTIAVLGFDIDQGIAEALSRTRILAVLIAAMLYLSYELPALWAATELLQNVPGGNTKCAHCGALQS